MAENVKTVTPAAAAPNAQAFSARAAKRKTEASALLPKASPRTMALTAILVCFAASGALRLGDLWRRGDLEAMFAAPAPAQQLASDKRDVKSSDMPGAAPAAGEARLSDAIASEDASADKGALEKARDMQAAIAAMEEAIAAGDYATASTPQPSGDASYGGGPTRLPPINTASAGQAADVLAAIKKREAELDAYAAKLAERNEALTLAAERLDTRIQELETSKEQFEVLVATVDQAATRDVAHLIKMYEKMKPKEAGPLFDAMDPSFAAGFLARMKPDAASAIMAKMSTGAAYAVSLQLAGRNVRKTPGAGPTPKGAAGAAGKKQP